MKTIKTFFITLFVIIAVVILVFVVAQYCIIDGKFPQLADYWFPVFVIFIVLSIFIIPEKSEKQLMSKVADTRINEFFTSLIYYIPDKIKKILPVRKRNIVKIKVQRKISFAFAIAAIAILLLLTFCGIYFIYSSKISTSHRTNDEAYAAVLLVFALIPLLFKEGAGRQKYVSDIIVTNYSLQIIYRIKSKIVELKEFAVGEIKSIETVLNIKLHKEKNNIQSESNTKTTIMLKDGNSLLFDAQPSIITGKHYAFLFSMIKNRAMLPNFSYRLNISDDNIDGENKAINYKIFNDYVEYYSKHLRPQLFLKPMTFSNREFWFLMAVFIPLVILVACVIFMELRHLSLENIKDFFNIAAWKEFFKNP